MSPADSLLEQFRIDGLQVGRIRAGRSNGVLITVVLAKCIASDDTVHRDCKGKPCLSTDPDVPITILDFCILLHG